MMQMEAQKKGCHQPVPCCDDQTVLIDNDFEKTPALQSLTFGQQLCLVAYVFNFPFRFQEIQKPVNSFFLKHPPLYPDDIFILHESFLI